MNGWVRVRPHEPVRSAEPPAQERQAAPTVTLPDRLPVTPPRIPAAPRPVVPADPGAGTTRAGWVPCPHCFGTGQQRPHHWPSGPFIYA